MPWNRHATIWAFALVASACGSLWPSSAPTADPVPPTPQTPTDEVDDDGIVDTDDALDPEADLQTQISALEALGYVEGDVPAVDQHGVVLHDETRAYAGYNLYTSEDRPRVWLIDMAGEVVHTWDLPKTARSKGRDRLRRADLLDDGEILVLIENKGLVRMDKDGEVLWQHHGKNHHDFELQPDGSIYVLDRKAHLVPQLHETRPVLVDELEVFGPDGEQRSTLSMVDAFEASDCCRQYLKQGMHGDVFHSNTVEVLDGSLVDRHPAFAAGNVLMSWRNLNAIGIVDPEAGAVVWAVDGFFHQQHQPTLVDGDQMMLFDNFDRARGPERSRVIVFDPFTEAISWEFPGDREMPFFSRTGGSNARLPNGNVLITECRAGRVHEVTPDGTLVWSYVNAARIRKKGGGEAMARIFEMQRLSMDRDWSWLEASAPAE